MKLLHFTFILNLTWPVLTLGQSPACTFTAPYSESFNGSTWQSGTGFANVGNNIDSCWLRPTNAKTMNVLVFFLFPTFLVISLTSLV